MITVSPNAPEAYDLLHNGALALCKVESNGIRIDSEYCKKQESLLKKKLVDLKLKIDQYPEIRAWKAANPQKTFNIQSGPQLGAALFKYSNHTTAKKTASGKASTDEESLVSLGIPLVDDVLKVRKIQKVMSTYLGGFIREEIDGWIHPFYNLDTVRTFRGSCDAPNMQNIPVRIDWIKKLCRKAVIPRPGNLLGEIDYSGAEIRGAACYHQDPNMIEEITNVERDMHRDMAMECYMLEMDQWTSKTRYCGKNKFIFPEFYGDYYKNCATGLWDAIPQLDLKTVQGVPLKKHLAMKGIKTFEQFVNHIERVEADFWGVRFPVYAAWKQSHLERYWETGEIHLLTGFTCSGIIGKNDVINYPVQGVAFHWLLWSLTQLQRYFEENGFQTKIIGQIHDSIILDIVPEEMKAVFIAARKIMTRDIREHWPWIIVPLEVEFSLSPRDRSWYEKKDVKATPPCPQCKNIWRYDVANHEDSRKSYYSCPVCKNRERQC